MAAQPPGPGLPRHAPSVKISTSDNSGIETVGAQISDAAVEAKLAQIFKRILRPDQRSFRLVEPIKKPRQEKTECTAAREQGQGGELRRRERSRSPIAVEQQSRLGHIEAAIGFEAPSIEADRQIIGEKVGAGEIEVNQAGNFTVAKENVIGKEVSVDHPGRQAARARAFEQLQLGAELFSKPRLHLGRTIETGIEDPPPTSDRKIVCSGHPERGAGPVQRGKRRAEPGAMKG